MPTRRLFRKHWMLLGLLTMTACDGRPLGGDQPTANQDNSITMTTPLSGDASVPPSSGGADGASEATCATRPTSPLCSQNPSGAVSVTSSSDLLSVMPGRWLLCGDQSIFGVDAGDVGLEITADNHWYKLFPAQGGGTVRGAGFDQEGTWTSFDLGDYVQVNFDIFGSGTIITVPAFASTPRGMRLNNNGVFVGTYVIDPAVATGSARCALTSTAGDASVPPSPGNADGGNAPACDVPPQSSLCSQNPAGSVAVGSVADLLATMPGRWLLCGSESVFAVNGGDVGLEITADNHWYKLFAAEGGATVRGAGFDEEGTWTAFDEGDHIQVNFDIFGSGTVITAPVFASAPRSMRLDNNGVFVGNYVIDPTIATGSVRCPHD